MLIRMSYDRPVGEIKAAVRASARPRNLDNYSKQSSTVLYRLYGNLAILHFRFYDRKIPYGVRFCALFLPKGDGCSRLLGAFAFAPFEPLVALPVLAMLVAAIVTQETLAAAIPGVLTILLFLLVCFLLMQFMTLRLLGKDRAHVLQFLQKLGD